MSVQERVEKRKSKMPSISAFRVIESRSKWAYRSVTGAGQIPTLQNNTERLQFGYSSDEQAKTNKSVAELRRDTGVRAISFCAIRALMPSQDRLGIDQGGDYLIARMQFFLRTRKGHKFHRILLDSWVSMANPDADLSKVDFDDLESDYGTEQVDHVVLGETGGKLNGGVDKRVVFIATSIIEAAANQRSDIQQEVAGVA